MVVTSAFSHVSVGDRGDVAWEQEEWKVSAALIPLNGSLNSAGADLRAVDATQAHDLDFDPWWRDAGEFDFGDARHLGDTLVWPWTHHRRHRRTDQLLIEPRADFLRYHALDQRPLPDRAGGTEYVHPLEESVALRTWVERIAFYDPFPFVEVQRDYLRDYLSARRAALLIAVVADRFANGRTVADLELEQVEQEPIGEHAWIRTTIHEQSPHNRDYAMGRSSLYWNVLVRGYEAPKRSRSPWHLHDERQAGAGSGQAASTFVVDAEGTRRPADDADCPLYLYFSLRALDRYLATPGYHAAFHMRTWGRATSPHGGVDVGVNSHELLNAFMPDIAKLPVEEQMHWASYSVRPDGEICWAMVETRMQLRPPDLPGVVDLVTRAFNGLVDAAHSRFGVQLGNPIRDLPATAGRLSIGPLHRELSEVATLAVPLYSWVIERIEVASIRDILTAQGISFEQTARQLGLLRLVLARVIGKTDAEARSLTGALDALNELRAKAAHVADADYVALLPRLGLSAMPPTPRRYWDAVVDAVTASLNGVAEAMRDSR